MEFQGVLEIRKQVHINKSWDCFIYSKIAKINVLLNYIINSSILCIYIDGDFLDKNEFNAKVDVDVANIGFYIT